jgi:hypothetical protein
MIYTIGNCREPPLVFTTIAQQKCNGSSRQFLIAENRQFFPDYLEKFNSGALGSRFQQPRTET